MFKKALLLLLICFSATLWAQNNEPNAQQTRDIEGLIAAYAQARESRDTVLLKNILTDDIDQLVSSGQWRRGMAEAVEGMLQSSASNPGGRTLTVEKIRLLSKGSAIVDARYEIANADGSIRKMWSSFIVVDSQGQWKITAIRNMLPSGQQ
ncbi:MAG: DUF4440 domain-containing protein [Flavobacteriaceae bacterium]